MNKKQLLNALVLSTFLFALVFFLGRLYLLGEAPVMVVLILVGTRVAGPRSACPSCERWFVRRTIGRQFLGIKTRTERRYSVDSPVGDFSYSHTVPAVYEEYRHDYVCRKCGHRWSDFDSRSGTPFMKSTAGMS